VCNGKNKYIILNTVVELLRGWLRCRI